MGDRHLGTGIYFLSTAIYGIKDCKYWRIAVKPPSTLRQWAGAEILPVTTNSRGSIELPRFSFVENCKFSPPRLFLYLSIISPSLGRKSNYNSS